MPVEVGKCAWHSMLVVLNKQIRRHKKNTDNNEMCILIILLRYQNKEGYSSKTKVNLSKVNICLLHIVIIQQINKKLWKICKQVYIVLYFCFLSDTII